MAEVTYYIKVFIALLALINPIEAIPLFLTNTKDLSHDQRIGIAKKTSLAVFVILIFSLFLGRYVLQLFGISTASFSFAGGVIIFLISIQMVMGKDNTTDKSIPNQSAQNDAGDIAVVPLAIPLLAGPGAISSIIVYGSNSGGLKDDIFLSMVVLLISFVVWMSLNAATKFGKLLHQTGEKVLTKISGLLVAAIAVELIFMSIKQMLQDLSK